MIAEGQREGRIEPFADNVQFGIAIDMITILVEPCTPRKIAHDIEPDCYLVHRLAGAQSGSDSGHRTTSESCPLGGKADIVICGRYFDADLAASAAALM